MKMVLDHLAQLVAADTQNPPRAITVGDSIFDYLRGELQGFEVNLQDFGQGCLAFHAVRGNPTRLFNFHLDTVPTSTHWTKNPFELTVDADRAYGLGACDIKGALACMLSAAKTTKRDLGLLVTTDE